MIETIPAKVEYNSDRMQIVASCGGGRCEGNQCKERLIVEGKCRGEGEILEEKFRGEGEILEGKFRGEGEIRVTQSSTVALSKLQVAVIPTYIKKMTVTAHCVMETFGD
jgi:hypothetical protein